MTFLLHLSPSCNFYDISFDSQKNSGKETEIKHTRKFYSVILVPSMHLITKLKTPFKTESTFLHAA